jgi:S1-C subfamily serine protease
MIMLRVSRAIVTALLLTSPGVAVAEPEGGPAHWLEAIVRVHAEIPADARTAAFLGRERDGSGVVIDDAGLIVTIGYLITEAMGAEVTTASGQGSRADIVGFDIASGLGLLRAAEPLAVKPLPIGAATALTEKTPVVVAAFGGPDHVQPAVVVSRRTFAGYWEYLLEDAIFTTPPHPAGAALLCSDRTANSSASAHWWSVTRRQTLPATCSCRSTACSRSWVIYWHSAGHR